MNRSARKPSAGYTLVEATIALFLVGSTLGIAVPLVQLANRNLEKINQLAASQRDQAQFLNALRQDAHQSVTINIAEDGKSVIFTNDGGETIRYAWEPERFEVYSSTFKDEWSFQLDEAEQLLEVRIPNMQPIVHIAIGCSVSRPVRLGSGPVDASVTEAEGR